MSVRIRTSRALTSLSLTPLIDVVFLLLIFFLVATKFEQEERELSVNLPQASEAQPAIAKPKELFVNVTADGSYFVSGKTVDAVELERILKQAWTNNPGRQKVIIRADEDSKTKHIVRVMDLCNKANIRDYHIATSGRD